MSEATESPSRQNYYDGLFDRMLKTGLSPDLANRCGSSAVGWLCSRLTMAARS